MSDPDAPPLDEARIVEVLDQHQVDYVLVGGMGGRLHGATKLTRDFDVCPETGRENLGRLADALKELGAKMRGLVDTGDESGGESSEVTPMSLLIWPAAL